MDQYKQGGYLESHLCQVLYGVDVVVGGRADQPHPGDRVSRLSYVLGNLETRPQ